MTPDDAANFPAFPASLPGDWAGISLRDYVATQCLLIAAARSGEIKEYDLKAIFGDRGGMTKEEIIAALAYRMADALLARREKR